MITVDYKSTGTLLNELITAGLKIRFIGSKESFLERQRDLVQALKQRGITLDGDSERFEVVEKDFTLLQTVLHDLWWAVEDTVKLRNADPNDIEAVKQAGYAALKAFELNAKRCDIIRDMDNKLGEGHVTFLEKSY